VFTFAPVLTARLSFLCRTDLIMVQLVQMSGPTNTPVQRGPACYVT